MPLFRLHRGGLAESLATTIVVNCLTEILNHSGILNYYPKITIENIVIRPYPSKLKCFDARIGWYTHMVSIEHIGTIHVLGFLSESLTS